MLAAHDITVSLVDNRIALLLDPAGAAITNFATAYDAASGMVTITAATAGDISMEPPLAGVSVDQDADTISVDLRRMTRFAGVSIVGGAGPDSITIGRGGVNLAVVNRGASSQGLSIDTGDGVDDTIWIAGPIVAKGAGAVNVATQGLPAVHGILLESDIRTPGGSQTFAGAVTLLGDVAIQAGRGIAFTSTVDGASRLTLSAGRAITVAGDVGGMLPLTGLTLAAASRVTVDRGLHLDGSGTAVGTSGLVVGAGVDDVVFPVSDAPRTITAFSGAGIRFLGGSEGSRISGVTSTGNGIGVRIDRGSYARTVITGSSFSGNSAAGVSLTAARRITIGGSAPGAGNAIVSNGGYGVTAAGGCRGSLVLGNEIGGNTLGEIENFLDSRIEGGTVTQNATRLRVRLDDVGRASYRAQKARTYAFDVTVNAFAVAARSTGRLDTRSGSLDIDASVGFDAFPPEPTAAVGPTPAVLGTNRVAAGLTPLRTLPGIEFPRSTLFVGSDAIGKRYRVDLGPSAFAGILPLADLENAPITAPTDGTATVDVWVNSRGYVSRVAGSFEGGSFEVAIRDQNKSGAVAVAAGLGVAPTVSAGMSRIVAAPSGDDAAVRAATPLLPGVPTNGVSGVRSGHSTLVIPNLSNPGGPGHVAAADWYFPTQIDGTVTVQGVIWLQHAFGTTGGVYSSLADQLARDTNSIVVAPTLPSIGPSNSPGWWLSDAAMAASVASLFEGERSALIDSAIAAGYDGDLDELTGRFVLSGHSDGGGFATAVAAEYAAGQVTVADLVGVIMYDGVSAGAFDGSGSFAGQLSELDEHGIAVYQIAAPAQLWNAYGATTNALMAARPGRFNGMVLVDGSPVDAMAGGDPFSDFVAQRLTRVSSPGNASAIHTLGAGWINDLYAGNTPASPVYGFYASADQPIIMGDTAAVALPSPIANAASPNDRTILTEIDAIGGLSGFLPGAVINAGTNGVTGITLVSNGVTGVKVGTAALDIPCGETGYATTADWYFPTQADGRVVANGLIWLQHGDLGDASSVTTLAMQIARQTNSIVVAPTISPFATAALPDRFLGSEAMREAVAGMFLGARGALTLSATAAGHQGVMPGDFVLVGSGAGGGFATSVGGRAVDNGAAVNLLGVVMVDGVAGTVEFATSFSKLASLGIPVYQIAAPPQASNDWGRTTSELALLLPDQFVGVQIDDGSAIDAVVTLATGWINDIYGGFGPTDPAYGLYGVPNDGTYVANVPIVLGETWATALPAPPPVDLNQYVGTWYEQGSVKQDPSVVLVNTKSVYTPQPDDSILVENSGNASGPDGPAWSVTGSAVPVNAFNTRFDVDFSGEPEREEPGNYWILDYAPDYSWAIVGDPNGTSGSILTRDQVVPEETYDALVDRARQLGVRGTITRTAQFPPAP